MIRCQHEVTMSHRYVPAAALMAASMLVAAQSGAVRSFQPHSEEEGLRLVTNGRFAEARQVLTGLIEDATRAGSPPVDQARRWRLLGVAENRLGRYAEA